tara:strand:- start:440 stop:1894 length:1455 start_codon:yes stop_codon:yes gene_type:complete
MRTANILLVDDEGDIRSLLRDILEDEGYHVWEAAHSMQAEHLLKQHSFDLVILDIWLENSEKDGVELLKLVKEAHPDMAVLMISGHGNIETAVQTTRLGAYDFIEKPFKTERLLVSVRNAAESATLKRENKVLRQNKSEPYRATRLSGKSEAIERLKKQIERIAETESRVMITGEAGTGKSLLARVIHEKSKRSQAPFVSLNCAMLAPEEIDPALFGSDEQEGLLDKGQGGTLFLDEISDMPLSTQGRLLRALQEQTFRQGKDSDEGQQTLDIRIISSANQNISEMIEAGKFRSELYYRLNVVPLVMPSLRQRSDDIEELTLEIIKDIASQAELPMRRPDKDVLELFRRYHWPGNIRELKNILEWLLIMAPNEGNDGLIHYKDLPVDLKSGLESRQAMARGDVHSSAGAAGGGQGVDTSFTSGNTALVSKSLKEARADFEYHYLKFQLERFEGNISKTAKFIGMERTALHRKLKSLDIALNASE